MSDFPLSDKLYSTLGGIYGYSFRIIKLSFSNSFKDTASVLCEMVYIYLFNSLYLTILNSIKQYKITILYLPRINDKV